MAPKIIPFLTLIIFVFFSPIAVQAQHHTSTEHHHSLCGTEEYQKQLDDLFPERITQRKAAQKAMADWIADRRNNEEPIAERSNVLPVTIPVVVHIVYNNPSQNFTDEQIFEIIEKMNTDYRLLNDNFADTPAEFAGVAADTEIEFCLAARAPNGAPTNGITRTLTSTSSFNANDQGIKFTEQGGKDAWPAGNYMNVWIGPLSGPAGFATLAFQPVDPNDPYDGIVLSAEVLKTSLPQEGHRILVHEVGHWLSLEHPFIWTDEGEGDYCDDTPAYIFPTFGGCPDEVPYLAEGEKESFYQLIAMGLNLQLDTILGHMFTNYMDYADTECMTMFTQNQKERMHAGINLYRPQILSSNGCILPSNLPAVDAGMEEIFSPRSEICPEQEVASDIYVRNLGSQTITTMQINYGFDGNTSNSFTWTGELTTGQGASITLPGISAPAPGNHNFTSIVTEVNGTIDNVGANNSKSISLEVFSGNTYAEITEGFEGSFPPANWALGAFNNPSPPWGWEKTTAASFGGNASMRANNYLVPAFLGPEFHYIYLPRLDLSGIQNPTLSFDLAYLQSMEGYYNPELSPDTIYGPAIQSENQLIFEVSTDCGNTFTTVYEKAGISLATVFDTTLLIAGEIPVITPEEFIPSDESEWRHEIINLANFAGESNVIIRILDVAVSQHIYIDNININQGVLLADFNATTANTICMGNSVNFDFTGFAPTTDLTYEWAFDGGIPASSNEENPTIEYPNPGAYDVELTIFDGTDQSVVTKTGFVTVLPQPTAVITQNTPASSASENNGSVQVEVFDGIPPYHFTIMPGGQSNTTGFFDNLGVGEYTVIAENEATGCVVELPLTIDLASATSDLERQVSQIHIFPNPNDGRFEVLFAQPFSQDIKLSLVDLMGRELQSETVVSNHLYRATWDVQSLSAGLYFLKIAIEGEVVTKKLVIK